MIGVIAHMRLQHNLFLSSNYPAAIDEVSDHMPDFGNMSVSRDVIATRQHKSRKQAGIGFKRILQITERHEESIYLFRHIGNRQLLYTKTFGWPMTSASHGNARRHAKITTV